jgi:hypothetical protein
MPILKKTPRPRLIDDAGFLIQRVQEHERKPDTIFRSEPHRAWIRSLLCAHCGKLGCEAAHIRFDTQTGAKQTPSDIFLWPGDYLCHQRLQHVIGERSFWNGRMGLADPHRFILMTYALRSPCPRTVAEALTEFARRYPATPQGISA